MFLPLYHIVSDVYDLFDAKFLMWNTIPNYSNLPIGRMIFGSQQSTLALDFKNAVTKWGNCMQFSLEVKCLLVCLFSKDEEDIS